MRWQWLLIDRILSRCLGIKPLREDDTGVLGIRLRRHCGQPVRIDDGVVVSPGDQLIEIHLDNTWFRRNRNKLEDTRYARRWQVYPAVAEDLKYLAGRLGEGKIYPDAKALLAETTILAPMNRLGFTVVKKPGGWRSRLTVFHHRRLQQTFHLGKGSRERSSPVLADVWMSRSKLLSKYGSASQ
ncbi:hypothetical protein ACFLW0_00585 [Chloroflexota bacterium]